MNTRVAALILSMTCAFAITVPMPIVIAQPVVQGTPMELPVDATPLTFKAGGKKVSLEIEIADTPEHRARGLMFRTDLPKDRGMLFVFGQTRQVSFWMQNTPLPLDLVFVGDDGKVIGILPGEPYSTASIDPGEASRFVLELHAGTAAEIGIEAATRLHHPVIDAVANQ